jgi:hypothetical protein
MFLLFKILHLVAVEQAFKSLVPPLDKSDPACNLIPWLNEVRASQNAITSVISLPIKSKPSSGSHDIKTKLRYALKYAL